MSVQPGKVLVRDTLTRTNKKGKPYTVFILEVTSKDEKRTWELQRRFRQIFAFRKRLIKEFPTSNLPKLAKKLIGSSLTPAFVAKRAGRIEVFFAEALNNPHTYDCPDMLLFLDPAHNPAAVDAAEGAVLSGLLSKRGHKVRTMKKRWCVLKDGRLYYYAGPTDYEPLGVVALANYYKVVEAPLPKKEKKKPSYRFDLLSRFPKQIPAYSFRAQTAAIMHQWVNALRGAIGEADVAAKTGLGSGSKAVAPVAGDEPPSASMTSVAAAAVGMTPVPQHDDDDHVNIAFEEDDDDDDVEADDAHLDDDDAFDHALGEGEEIAPEDVVGDDSDDDLYVSSAVSVGSRASTSKISSRGSSKGSHKGNGPPPVPTRAKPGGSSRKGGSTGSKRGKRGGSKRRSGSKRKAAADKALPPDPVKKED